MNSDPYDSAAWRIFGMLDPEESAAFDEAMRQDPVLQNAYREMNRLAAAVAASTASAVDPPESHLGRLRAKIGIHRTRHPYFWFGMVGWCVAAVCAWLWISSPKTTPAAPPTHTSVNQTTPPATIQTQTVSEPRHLLEEIQALRENLEKFQSRERILFGPVAGKTMPVVMTMTPPDLEQPDADATSAFPITAMLGDALRAASSTQPNDESAPTLQWIHPTAIPIYDPVRDSGTLVVSQLPAIDGTGSYNLWVVTEEGGSPIYLGQLPENAASGAEAFDFSLGSTMILPWGFILTLDPPGPPAIPSETTSVLVGPAPLTR